MPTLELASAPDPPAPVVPVEPPARAAPGPNPDFEGPVAPAVGTADPPPPARKTEPIPPRLRIPYRILLHVARQGRVGPDEVPPFALSQAGMVEALHVRQGAVAAALQRLVRADLLDVERSHVRGGDRRLKVYRLTGRGEELVRDLRRRSRGRG